MIFLLWSIYQATLSMRLNETIMGNFIFHYTRLFRDAFKRKKYTFGHCSKVSSPLPPP